MYINRDTLINLTNKQTRIDVYIYIRIVYTWQNKIQRIFPMEFDL